MSVPGWDENRDATVVALYGGGATMAEIGGISGGISRQRVQQILQRNGVGHRSNAYRYDPLHVLAACRKPGIRNWHQAALEAGVARGGMDVKHTADLIGMRGAIERLFRLRRIAHRRAQDAAKRTVLTAQYRELCERLGRPATSRELQPSNGVPFWNDFLRVFPGMRELRIAAGIDPKDQRGNKRGLRTYCKRNHLLAETRNKWGACVECRRICQRVRKASA